ncbi:MAG TPA: anti-sigma factor, partial [Chitinophagaceae bacterium]|nr:anti-sigma factor [Chitinophagaceae bacterium]
QARLQFEEALENQLLQDAVAPPVALKENITNALRSLADPGVQTFSKPHAAPVSRMAFWKIMAAASVVLLAGSLIWAISLNKKYQNAQQANNQLQRQLNVSTAKMNALEEAAQTLQAPGMKAATLVGTQNAPGAFANVYWDTTTKNTYLLINNMPKPASDKQYQLWALLDGQPIDLGVIDQTVWQEKLLVKMKNVQNAEAFAITLEPRGGSPAPTMEAMYVMGKL